MKLRTMMIALLAAVTAQAGCGQDLTWSVVDRMIESDFPGVPSITTDSLARRLDASDAPEPVLIDARSDEEYAVSHLPGAVRVDPEATSLPDSLLRDGNRPVVVYCSVGYRSAKLTKQLRDNGMDAVNLKGSIFRWANEGRPVVRGDSAVSEVHPYNRTWGLLLDDRWHPDE